MVFRALAGSRVWWTIGIVLACSLALAAQNPTPPSNPFSMFPANIRMMLGYGNRIGETFRVRVTAATDMRGRPIWGTDVYTDDSDLTAAVVHAGLLAPGQEGEVLITFLPGQGQYQGSARNGVTTDTFDSWDVSYRLARVTAASASVPTLPARSAPTFTPPAIPGNINIQAPVANLSSIFIVGGNTFNGFPGNDQTLWRLLGGPPTDGRGVGFDLMGLRSRVGESFEYDITGSATGGTIWGDGVYTDDSDLSVTSVHAGLLRPGQRGRVRITVLPGLQSYNGITQNGVTSQRYGSWDRSYRVELADPRPPHVLTTATPAASISGRITDANRALLQNVPVSAAILSFRDGRSVVTEMYTGLTNAQGEYQFSGVIPGTYFITARRTATGTIRSPITVGTASPGISWFPGVATMDAAMQVPVRGNEQVVGINLIDAQAPLYKVSGRVLNPPAEGIRSVTYAPRGTSAASALAGQLLINGTSNPGEFEVMLPPGAWDVFPVVVSTNQVRQGVPPAGTPAYKTGRVSVDVIDRNVDGITLTMGSIDIAGRIIREPTGSMPENVEIQLAAVDGTPAPLWHHARSTKAGADGRFSIPAVPPGEYRIQVSTPIPNAYVSDIRVGQDSVFNDAILRVKTEPLESVEIILGSGGGTVQGEVRIPSPTAPGKVILVPAAPRRQNASLYKQELLTAGTPEFRFSNVPPGQYTVFALANLPAGAEMNAEFMSKYEQFGESITVTAGSVVRVPAGMVVKVIEAEQ
jgi:hypothetical protein